MKTPAREACLEKDRHALRGRRIRRCISSRRKSPRQAGHAQSVSVSRMRRLTFDEAGGRGTSSGLVRKRILKIYMHHFGAILPRVLPQTTPKTGQLKPTEGILSH